MNVELKEKLDSIKKEDAYIRFKDLLKEMFELDKGDLDFGIYKILNTRKGEIESFLNGTGKYEEKGLPQQIIEALDLVTCDDKTSIEKEIEKLAKQLKDLGSDENQINDNKKIKELKQKLNNGTDLTSLQVEIYNNLYEFFSRYYDEGDFISKRRYKKDAFMIPYNGEEVKFTWANKDQYYIKTSLNFNTYTFKFIDLESNEWKINFKVVNATIEKNNNKENDKVFMLYDENIVKSEDVEHKTYEINKESNELTINFLYDTPVKKYIKPPGNKTNIIDYAKKICKEEIQTFINKEKSLKLLKSIFSTNKEEIDLFDKNLNRFVAKNQFDFFIHKDLKDFLNRELDFYIKSEIMNLDDIEDKTNEYDFNKQLIKIKVIKKIAKVLINFLAKIEDFQKTLYLKKKFVVDTNYIITIDKIEDEELRKVIFENSEQLKEWGKYYDLDSMLENIDSKDVKNSNEIKHLPIDTKYFDKDIKEKIVEYIDKLDIRIDGLFVNGDNIQAEYLLANKYMKSITVVYLDPPYNAKDSKVIYKNNFENSAWITMMDNRLRISKEILALDGKHIVAIDENESNELGMLLKSIFNEQLITQVACVQNPRGIQGKNFSYNHEYYYFIYNNKSNEINQKKVDNPHYEQFRNWGSNSPREQGWDMFYPIKFRKLGDDNYELIEVGESCKREYHPNSDNILDDETITIYPIDNKGIERKWRYSRESLLKKLEINKNFIICKFVKKHYQVHFYKEYEQYRTCWYGNDNDSYNDEGNNNDNTKNKFDASIWGTQVLTNLSCEKKFSFPKSVFTVEESIKATEIKEESNIVLDYFAGSGTTGHAVIDLNREDGGNRKYILVEMGEYFDTVLVPRIKKVIYCNEWKSGKPLNRNTGVSQIVKYQTIESYEDTLNNIEVNSLDALLNPDYIKYSFDLNDENLLKNESFEKPFDYKMNIQIGNEIKSVNIDLIETFNYLVGLYVDRNFITKDVEGLKHKLVIGNLRTDERVAIIWRDIDKETFKCNRLLNEFIEDNLEYLQGVEYIYINGDVSVDNDDLKDKVLLLEEKFKKEMFNYEEF